MSKSPTVENNNSNNKGKGIHQQTQKQLKEAGGQESWLEIKHNTTVQHMHELLIRLYWTLWLRYGRHKGVSISDLIDLRNTDWRRVEALHIFKAYTFQYQARPLYGNERCSGQHLMLILLLTNRLEISQIFLCF